MILCGTKGRERSGWHRLNLHSLYLHWALTPTPPRGQLLVKPGLSGVTLPKARGPAWMIPEGPLQPAHHPASAKPVNDDGDEGCQSRAGPTGREQGVVSSLKAQPCTKPWLHRQVHSTCGGRGRGTSPDAPALASFTPKLHWEKRNRGEIQYTDRWVCGEGLLLWLRTRRGG